MAIKFGFKAMSVLASGVFTLALLPGCNTEEAAPPAATPTTAPGAAAPGKAAEPKAAVPPVTAPPASKEAKK